MTGHYVTDVFNALKYHYNANTGKYPEKWLGELGVGADRLPAVVEMGAAAGPVTDAAAKFLGLNAPAQVIAPPTQRTSSAPQG